MREIILFDGDCGVCNDFVLRTIAKDSANRFLFAPLGGQTAIEFDVQRTDRVMLIVESNTGESRILNSSAAVLYIMKHQDGRLARFFAHAVGWIPSPILDVFYAGFARIRHLAPTSGNKICSIEFAARVLP